MWWIGQNRTERQTNFRNKQPDFTSDRIASLSSHAQEISLIPYPSHYQDSNQDAVLRHPDWSTDDVMAELADLGFELPSRFLASEIRSRFKADLKFLIEIGAIDADARPTAPLHPDLKRRRAEALRCSVAGSASFGVTPQAAGRVSCTQNWCTARARMLHRSKTASGDTANLLSLSTRPGPLTYVESINDAFPTIRVLF